MVRHVRFHGRGGEGVKLASRIVSRAAFLAGRSVQDAPLYGAERRGAPVVAFVRISDSPIHERGYIEAPDVVVVMDHSLLGYPEAAVRHGLDAFSLVLVNSTHSSTELATHYDLPGRVVTLDMSSIALELLGHHFLSAPVAGFVAKATTLAPWELVAEAVRVELLEIGLSNDRIAPNLDATRRAFDAAAVADLVERPRAVPRIPTALFVLPRLPARIAAPSIDAEATSALRTMAGWRVYRPVIELGRCTRCLICFVLCPEGAIHLDAKNDPVVDYDHCKGCLVCVTECPPKAISETREEAA